MIAEIAEQRYTAFRHGPFLRYLTAPGNPDQVGAEEMVFAEDVLEVIETSG